jgi:hypothetical protein
MGDLLCHCYAITEPCANGSIRPESAGSPTVGKNGEPPVPVARTSWRVNALIDERDLAEAERKTGALAFAN